jgi:hypothetical protein
MCERYEIVARRAEAVQQHHDQLVPLAYDTRSQIAEGLQLHSCTL